MISRFARFAVPTVLAFTLMIAAAPAAADSPYDQWSHGPSPDPDFFPIAVWLQAPSRAQQYLNAGFNIYVGLWNGPTEQHLSQLAAVGMQTICSQNSVGLAHINDPTIIGWLQPDEPDNAQSNGSGGYYSPMAPLPTTTWDTYPGTDIYTRYLQMKSNDPSRPVMLNLGQAVAYDNYIGRGTRRNHPEDYPEYIQGCDIVSFDIYPVASSYPETDNKIWLPAYGVERLIGWSQPDQPVWNWIECTNISGNGKATPTQVKAEVWMSLISGSMGIGYFVHQIEPDFIEPALLYDAEMLAAVTDINWEIRSLARALNSPTIAGAFSVTSSSPIVPIDWMAKRIDGATYLFTVATRNGSTTGSFFSMQVPPIAVAKVIGEDREIPLVGGQFSDTFTPYQVHLYKIVSRWPGDTDGDFDVDLDDFVLLKQNFGMAAGAVWEDGDFNADGDVDLDDFVILKQNFGLWGAQ
ncbi:MAG: hypothetical protein GX591_02905 [Planctomycetes bacterium]|nr:hypothetical protein [Planctomycetota bacterium]